MSNGRGRHAKKIDTVHWTVGSFEHGSLAAGFAATLVGAAQHLPETILRIRGEVVVNPAGAAAAGDGARVTMGLILVPEGTGTTVLWSPFTDGDAPWIWWDVAQITYTEPVTDVIACQEALSARKVIDSKAMRKVRNTELQFVVENTTTQGVLSVDVFGTVRVLAGS